MDQSSNIPDPIEIYYWLYPSNKQIVINSLAIASTLGEGFISGSCLLKFYPLAFWVVWDKPTSFPINFTKIPKDQVKGLDETCEIMIDLGNIPHLDYPEVPAEDQYIMSRQDATFLAQPKNQKDLGSMIS